MKLIVNRSQQDQKGIMGGHKGVQFTLSYRLELTGEEQRLVERYRLGAYPLTFTNQQGTQIPADTISSLVRGSSSIVSDVTKLIREEDLIKDSCDQLPVLFDVCRSFGGDEVIHYPRKKEEG
jgi:hypothetical protein